MLEDPFGGVHNDVRLHGKVPNKWLALVLYWSEAVRGNKVYASIKLRLNVLYCYRKPKMLSVLCRDICELVSVCVGNG